MVGGRQVVVACYPSPIDPAAVVAVAVVVVVAVVVRASGSVGCVFRCVSSPRRMGPRWVGEGPVAFADDF